MLDPADRRLCRDGAPVELNARYLDALTLLVSEQGRLVTKDRFLDEVWRGVPVTDEALTQCIRTLRRQLGDDAARPRFIETVPKHGYRFVAPVDGDEARRLAAPRAVRWSAGETLLLGAAGTVGGGIAGFVGGLFYGFAGASQPLAPGMGAISILLVLLCLTILVAVIGGAGVAFGIALADLVPARHWRFAGGALGGFLIGAIVKLLGIDAFNLLIGRSPGDITGPFEGAVLGAAIGLASWIGLRLPTLRRRLFVAAGLGALAGVLIVACRRPFDGRQPRPARDPIPRLAPCVSTASALCSAKPASAPSARRSRRRSKAPCSPPACLPEWASHERMTGEKGLEQ